MNYRFSNSLLYEREQAIKANQHYTERWGATNIQRFDTDSPDDLVMQRQDVDLLLTINGTTYRVSEKFRDKDYNDLYIEVFSKYPQTVGWLQSGSADAIVYFTPKAVYWITHKTLKDFCLSKLFPAIAPNWYEEIFINQQTFLSKTIYIDKVKIPIKIIQAHNFEGVAWHTIGVSISFDVLQTFQVKLKKFELT
ncbi:MAG: hypothetical protein AUK44_00200 [Porphyromonadaceae bacterium CG2_30_38_12]|nr:MAG: hypothetical protein AUK44_00200 [Porphyromonadaceae bacterium CG2_30_38_12]